MPASAPVYFTPPEAARLLRVKPDKIIALIRRGELRGANLAIRLSGRPRFRIAAADLQAFLDARAAAAVAVPVTRRRRRKLTERPAGWISFFGMDRE